MALTSSFTAKSFSQSLRCLSTCGLAPNRLNLLAMRLGVGPWIRKVVSVFRVLCINLWAVYLLKWNAQEKTTLTYFIHTGKDFEHLSLLTYFILRMADLCEWNELQCNLHEKVTKQKKMAPISAEHLTWNPPAGDRCQLQSDHSYTNKLKMQFASKRSTQHLMCTTSPACRRIVWRRKPFPLNLLPTLSERCRSKEYVVPQVYHLGPHVLIWDHTEFEEIRPSV